MVSEFYLGFERRRFIGGVELDLAKKYTQNWDNFASKVKTQNNNQNKGSEKSRERWNHGAQKNRGFMKIETKSGLRHKI